MRVLDRPGTSPAFLLKALGEASGELRHAYDAIPARALTLPASPPDDGWSLLALAVHVRDVEAGLSRQLEAMLLVPGMAIEDVDMDDIPIEDDWRGADADDILAEFHYLRRQTVYLLWDLPERHWERTGVHPYRGSVTVEQLVKELYQHDLEHLWQARRMVDALPRRRSR